jgi:hypothetical protein
MNKSRYYLGAVHISDAVKLGNVDSLPNMHATLNSATREAEGKILDRERDCCIIVRIVRVVKRATPVPPIIIEDV